LFSIHSRGPLQAAVGKDRRAKGQEAQRGGQGRRPKAQEIVAQAGGRQGQQDDGNPQPRVAIADPVQAVQATLQAADLVVQGAQPARFVYVYPWR
jgi:hypothetical protein